MNEIEVIAPLIEAILNTKEQNACVYRTHEENEELLYCTRPINLFFPQINKGHGWLDLYELNGFVHVTNGEMRTGYCNKSDAMQVIEKHRIQ